jgi:hypothetical protein
VVPARGVFTEDSIFRDAKADQVSRAGKRSLRPLRHEQVVEKGELRQNLPSQSNDTVVAPR